MEVGCEYETLHCRQNKAALLRQTGFRIELDSSRLQLELMHHYTTHTCSTLSSSPALSNFWKVSVPRLALGHEYLMRAVLAVSALHMSHHRPSQRNLYVSAALDYHQAASRAAVKLLQKVTKENAPSLFLFSTLTLLIGLLSPCPS